MMMNDDEYSSGFACTPDERPEQPAAFGPMEEVYVSPSGYTRLLLTVCYGKSLILKTLKPEYQDKPFYLQALQKEFAIGYPLNHPHICSTIGKEDVPDVGPCIVLEYIDGITLTQYMQQGKLTTQSARKIIAELCDALQYLHSRQIVHRDLKPDNIMITRNGENVKLIDFSLADSDDSTLLKIPAGTRHYLAPEAQEKGYVPTQLADIYSLGVIVGEMGEALKDKRLLQVSSRCTCRQPERRTPSATAVAQAVLRPRVNRPAWIAAALLALFIALGGAYAYRHRQTPAEPATYPSYGNVPEYQPCRELLRQKAALLNGATLTPEDSLALMQAIENLLQETYPTPSMQATPAYRNQITYWSLEINKLRKVSAN